MEKNLKEKKKESDIRGNGIIYQKKQVKYIANYDKLDSTRENIKSPFSYGNIN